MFLESSNDLFLVAASLCLVLFTMFVCWAMYYLVVMLRNVSRMTTSVREKLELVDSILKLVKDKLEKGSNHMAVIADSTIKLVGLFMEKQKKNKKTK